MNQKRIRRTVFGTSLAAATLMLATACTTAPTTTTSPAAESPATAASPAASPQQKEVKPIKVTLSWLLQGVDAPLTLAMEKGYFTEEGLEVNFERGFGSADTAGKIAAGQYDIGFGDMYSMMEFNEKNPDSKLVAVAVAFNRAPFAIISLKSSGINSPKDLVGKKLGAPAGDAPRRLWRVFAESIGVDPNSVEWTTMEPKLRETFLLNGQVDAISGFISSMLPSILKGGQKMEDLNIFYYKDNGLEFYGNSILVKESFLKENPEVVRGFVKAYLRGLQETLKDPEAALDSVLAKGDQTMSRDAEKLRLQLALDNLWINSEVEKDGLGGIDSARFEKTIQQTVAGFDLKKTPAPNEVFNTEFLPPAADRQVPPAAERKPLL